MRTMIFQSSKKEKKKNDKMILSLTWNTMFTNLLITKKFLFWNFCRWEIRSFFDPKGWWKYDIYWLLKRSCFELFRDGKYGLILSQKVDERWYLIITEKFLFWIFRWWEIRSFFQPKSWMKDDIYLVFWAFHDIPGLGKNGFSCNGQIWLP